MRARATLVLVSAVVVAVMGGCSLILGTPPTAEVDAAEVRDAFEDVSLPELGESDDPGDALVLETTTVPPTTAPPAPPREPDRAFDGGYFATNSPQLTAEGQQRCESFATELAGGNGYLAFLGFADTRPTDYVGGNEKLSEDRAATVANCLQVALHRAGATGYTTTLVTGMGIGCPRSPDPEHVENRRVEVFVTAERITPRSSSCPP